MLDHEIGPDGLNYTRELFDNQLRAQLYASSFSRLTRYPAFAGVVPLFKGAGTALWPQVGGKVPDLLPTDNADGTPRALLTRRTSNGAWVMAGGGVESDESPQEAALWELEEETGIACADAAPRLRHLYSCVTVGSNYVKVAHVFYLATDDCAEFLQWIAAGHRHVGNEFGPESYANASHPLFWSQSSTKRSSHHGLPKSHSCTPITSAS